MKSAEFIHSHSKDVSISTEGVIKSAELLQEAMKKGEFHISKWKSHNPLHPQEMNDETVDWIFLIDTLNFSFWSESNTLFTVKYKEERYTGYWSLCAAIRRAKENGTPITSPSYWANISLSQLEDIFRSETSEGISLIEERQQVLQETGQTLLSHFNGTFRECILKANKSAQNLLQIIVQHFPSYKDEAIFKGKKVCIYKRAQILIADLWACFEGKGWGEFTDIDSLTMFADYRVPQILVHLGILEYSPRLMDLLNKGTPLLPQDPLEVEIRGNSIWAVELLRREMEKKNEKGDKDHPINAITIDFYLWDTAKERSGDMSSIPIHRTRSLFY